MKPKLYEIVSRCVLDGIEAATLDDDVSLPQELNNKEIENIRLSIMRELTDYIEFGTNDK